MIDVNLPTTFKGILGLFVVVGVAISVLYTTGILPVLIGAAVFIAVAFILYVLLTRFVRWTFRTKPWSRSSGSGGGGGGQR